MSPPQFDPPLLNSAGSLGFAPDLHVGMPWARFGAFVTNPISFQPRRPAGGPRLAEAAGGVLFHNGHFNPGFNQVVKRYSGSWKNSPLPIIVHLLAGNPWEMQKMIVTLETLENVICVEIGFAADVDGGEAVDSLQGAVGELPLIARLSLPRAAELADDLLRAGASAICLGPPRGMVALRDGEFLSGRLYGPGVFPQVMYTVKELARRGVPVIAGGGVYSLENAEALKIAGALAVQVDTALWRGDWLEGEGTD